MKNKKILIIMADFYPCASPNVTCFTPFINKLADNGNYINIVTSNVLGDNHPFTKPNIKVSRVEDKKLRSHFKWLKKFQEEKNKLKKTFYLFIRIITKLYQEIINYNPSIEKSYRGWKPKKVLNLIDTLYKQHDFDTVISISHPFCTHDIAYECKKKYNSKWVLLEYDAYSYNSFLFTDKPDKRREKELKYFDFADKIVLTPQLYNFYLNNELKTHKDKFYSMEFANFQEILLTKEENLLFDPSGVNLFYAGAFNIHIRNPKQIFAMLALCDANFKLTVVTKCDMGFVKKEIQDLGDKLAIIPRQEFEVVYFNELHSNILISIGNTISYQAPGKTFELMSTGNPIIHFKCIKEDPVEVYLKNYPSKLIVDLNSDKKIETEKINEFIKENHKKYSYAEIIKLCNEYEPSKIVQQFVKLIENIH